MTGARRAARLIHAALCAAVVLMTGLAIALRRAGAFPPTALPAWTGYLAPAIGTVLAAAALLLRDRLPPRGTGDPEAWWRAALPAAVPGWALADGAGMLGAVFHLVTGDAAALAASGVGLLALAIARPGALEAR